MDEFILFPTAVPRLCKLHTLRFVNAVRQGTASLLAVRAYFPRQMSRLTALRTLDISLPAAGACDAPPENDICTLLGHRPTAELSGAADGA